MAQAEQTRVIKIRFDLQGDKTLKNISSSLGKMNRSLKTSESVLSSFQNKFNALMGISFLGVGVGAVTGVVDSMQKLQDRLVNTEGSMEKATETMGKLRDVANGTNSGIEEMATIYSRLNLSLGDLNLSTDALLGLTLALKNTFRISGATAEEATASVIQLSQGLASGALRGQELRSVLEQNAIFGELLAKKLKIGRGALIKFGETGKITSKVVLETMAENFNLLAQRAANLRPTIAESLTKAFNDLKLKVNDLNNEFGITHIVAEGISTVFNNLNGILAVTAGLGVWGLFSKLSGTLATLLPYMSSLLGILVNVGIALATFFTSPLGIAVGVIGLLIYQLVDLNKVFTTIGTNLANQFPIFKQFIDYLGFYKELDPKKLDAFNAPAKELFDTIQGGVKPLGVLRDTSKGVAEEILDMGKELNNVIPFKTYGDALSSVNIKLKETDTRSPAQKLRDLNTSFEEGKTSVSNYNSQLLVLTQLINKSKGPKKSFDEMNKALEGNLNRNLEYGIYTLSEYQKKLAALNLEKLEQGFHRGYISAKQYHEEITKISQEFFSNSALYTGTANFLERIGTVSQNVASTIETTFSRLEDSLVDFIETGKFKFSDFAAAVIKDINRIILRAMIIRPLAEAVLGFAGGPSSSSGANGLGVNSNGTSVSEGGFAKGGAFNGGVQFFAKGGVVNSPTAFGMKGGMGVMGEAGSEAVMPLTRDSNGKLGVTANQSPVVVNIINNTSSEISQKETTGADGSKVLEIMINSKVKEGIASGSYDRTFQQAYGLKRKGN